eukprot:Skav220622  [mRNA]  locus=scaffold112:95519:96066:+ [translate_table: standard]
MGKVLHSCEPNSRCDVWSRQFHAVLPIQAGELVTMDYASTEPRLFRDFVCQCGAKNCRGEITGYAQNAKNGGDTLTDSRYLDVQQRHVQNLLTHSIILQQAACGTWARQHQDERFLHSSARRLQFEEIIIIRQFQAFHFQIL